jgi:hypothetical protein
MSRNNLQHHISIALMQKNLNLTLSHQRLAKIFGIGEILVKNINDKPKQRYTKVGFQIPLQRLYFYCLRKVTRRMHKMAQ